MLVGAVAFMLLLPNLSLAYELTGGLKIGGNSANIYGEDVEEFEKELDWEWKSKIAFCLGGFITYNINEVLAIQPEVLFTQKGAKIKEEIFGETLNVWMNLSYLEIPVFAKLLIPTKSSVKPNLFAGPYFAIKLSGKAKAEYAGESEEEDIEDIKGTDYGLVIGAGVDFGIGGPGMGKITVDLRYSLGLTTISSYEEEKEDIKNKVILLMVGYSF